MGKYQMPDTGKPTVIGRYLSEKNPDPPFTKDELEIIEAYKKGDSDDDKKKKKKRPPKRKTKVADGHEGIGGGDIDPGWERDTTEYEYKGPKIEADSGGAGSPDMPKPGKLRNYPKKVPPKRFSFTKNK